MIIDFHTHVFAPEDQIASVNTAFHGRVLASGDNRRTPPHTIENVLKAQAEPPRLVAIRRRRAGQSSGLLAAS